ncbi:hypothetical protein JR316_0006732 [Psilocybe cubensis]|uniref:Uncharacterized protein n=2 Tax=Psilocybe cubensis TaxID=181762 RepID=A0A8H8CEZ2_PSICU|nr:hypothetical protein JR316_0006732 [Psilocybe cubensis]KAH9480135.1 hypothetical protein JR316_0006732 [Psilocybe cubensis]
MWSLHPRIHELERYGLLVSPLELYKSAKGYGNGRKIRVLGRVFGETVEERARPFLKKRHDITIRKIGIEGQRLRLSPGSQADHDLEVDLEMLNNEFKLNDILFERVIRKHAAAHEYDFLCLRYNITPHRVTAPDREV